ncbi:MAG: hypothetical protein R3F17_00625 [Planctomycetota bacterium]
MTPLTTARAQLEVERNVHQVESARQELEGILEIYDGEPEGHGKREIVRRNRKQYELAQKELENARMERGGTWNSRSLRSCVNTKRPWRMRNPSWSSPVCVARTAKPRRNTR